MDMRICICVRRRWGRRPHPGPEHARRRLVGAQAQHPASSSSFWNL